MTLQFIGTLAENLIMSLRNFTPPRLSIDELGWMSFLLRWSQEATELARSVTFRYGIEGYTDEFILEMHDDLGVDVPITLHKGGVKYPPETEEGRRQAEQLLRQINTIVTASIVKHGQSTSLSLDDYAVLPYIEWDAYLYATLQGGKQLFPPASDSDIKSAEQRLGVQLPPSYKDFLRVSNGFWVGPNCCLLPVQNIGWMRDVDPLFPSKLLRTSTEEELLFYCKDKEYYRYNPFGLTSEDNDGLMCRRHKLLKALLLTTPGNSEFQIHQIGILPFAPDSTVPESRQGE